MRSVLGTLAFILVCAVAFPTTAGETAPAQDTAVTAQEASSEAHALSYIDRVFSSPPQRMSQIIPAKDLVYSQCGPTLTPCCCKTGATGVCMTYEACKALVGGECVDKAPGC